MAVDFSSMWLPELEMEDPELMNQYNQMTKLCDTVENFSADSFSSESNTENACFTDKSIQTPLSFEELAELNQLPSYQTASNFKRPPTSKPLASTSNTFTISFGDLKPKEEIRQFDDSNGYEEVGTGKVPTMARNTFQAQDHVLAERKRREKLNRHFISLSALLPNLKKMDKASVLEDASNFITELQGRVKELEGLSSIIIKGKDVKESIVALKRSRPITGGNDDEDDSSSNETNSADVPCKSSAEIEVRMSGSSVLVRIQSPKTSSLLVKVLRKMQKLGLSIISSNSMPFADTTLLITIAAQIEEDFFMTAADLVKNLQLAI